MIMNNLKPSEDNALAIEADSSCMLQQDWDSVRWLAVYISDVTGCSHIYTCAKIRIVYMLLLQTSHV